MLFMLIFYILPLDIGLFLGRFYAPWTLSDMVDACFDESGGHRLLLYSYNQCLLSFSSAFSGAISQCQLYIDSGAVHRGPYFAVVSPWSFSNPCWYFRHSFSSFFVATMLMHSLMLRSKRWFGTKGHSSSFQMLYSLLVLNWRWNWEWG